MKWKNRLTNYNFWISIVSAVLLILQAFNFEFDIAYISEIATAVLGLLVVIGIISDPTKSYNPSNSISFETGKNSEVVSENSNDAEEEKGAATEKVEEPSNANINKTENVVINTESDFKTVIDFISKELKRVEHNMLENNTISVDKENNQLEESNNIHNIVN